MKIHNVQRTSRLFQSLVLLLLLSLVSCSMPTGQPATDPSLQQTQMALGVQQTMLAQNAAQGANATIESQQATLVAQAAQATAIALQSTQIAQQGSAPTVDSAATQVALSVQQTLTAQGGSEPPPPPEPTTPSEPEPTTPSEPPPVEVDYDAMMKDANILLYEDIVNQPKLARYVKKTLDSMGLNYKDDGSAKGWLKSDLLSGGPNGKGWDLIIIALEYRTGISGEYFTYVNQALNSGASVILEIWYLDQISGGEVSTILTKCGVEVDRNYVGKNRAPEDIIVWPLPGANENPVMQDPNGGLTFTKVWTTWSYDDLGDLMQLTGRGDAQLLLGTLATSNKDHGVLTVCMDGKFTLMTFSSHSYPYNVTYPLWENMITNALKVRFAGQ